MIELYKTDDKRKHLLVRDLKDGQVAIILRYSEFSIFTGRIIQCLGDRGITLGMRGEYGRLGYEQDTLPVRLLEDGEKLVFRKEKE